MAEMRELRYPRAADMCGIQNRHIQPDLHVRLRSSASACQPAPRSTGPENVFLMM